MESKLQCHRFIMFAIEKSHYNIILMRIIPSFSVLESRLNELREECHWLRAVTWELCGKCPCKKCSKQMNPKTGKCFRHQKQGCSLDDCAHYVPVKRSPFACNCAKGRVLPVPQTWVQVSGQF